MSRTRNRYQTLSGIDLGQHDLGALQERMKYILDDKIHGISFSPYMDGQNNRSKVSVTQITQRLNIIKNYVDWIRTFSCSDGNEAIPQAAKKMGLKTMVGAWIEDDPQENELQLERAVSIAKDGHVDILAVGNEVMLRGELTEDQLVEYIKRVKEQVGDIPVGYVDAYFKFEECPKIVDACDVILVNCYPFWEGYPAQHAHIYMKEMYRRAQRVAGSKKVIIAETGWPTIGTPFGESVPSYENALKYFIDAYEWANEEGVDIMYFAAFDEAWKVGSEGDVGASWGIWDKDGNLKYE